MLTAKPSAMLMGGFIAVVIIAGFFGPWMISVILSLLVAACALTYGTSSAEG
jgi:hypothetical protein